MVFIFGISANADEYTRKIKSGTNPPSLVAYFVQTSAHVGEVAVLCLKYTLPAGGHLPSKLSIHGAENLTVLNRKTEPGKITLEVLVDKLGSLKTGPISLPYLDRNGKQHELTAKEVSLKIMTNLGKGRDIQLRPIQDIIPSRPVWVGYLIWGALLGGVLISASALFFYYKNRATKRVGISPEEPPYVWVKKEIVKLQLEELFEKGQVKEFYFRFSEILRKYLERLRGFPAAELTTEEITRSVSMDQDRKILPVLRHADLVKFADTVPTKARKDKEVELVLAYVKETTPNQETMNSEEVRVSC